MTSPKILLKAWNIQAKKQFGQTFLADRSTAEKIVHRAAIEPEDTIIEIGAGLGALTVPLAQAAAKVYAVERDPQLAGLLSTELLARGVTNVDIVKADILRLDLPALTGDSTRLPLVVGNLPYNISSQIVVRLLGYRQMIGRCILMFQKELAQRLTASPGVKDYGRLTVMLRYCADIQSLVDVNASCFYPRPKVDSEVIEILFRSKFSTEDIDEALLFRVIRAAFGRRRKTLKNALARSRLHLPADAVRSALIQAGIDPTRRAETLEAAEFIALSQSLAPLIDKNRHPPSTDGTPLRSGKAGEKSVPP